MRMQIPSSGERDFECIDPGLGAQIWRLDDPTTAPGLRDRLDLHVRHCADCRLALAVAREAGEGLRAGRLVVAGPLLPAWIRWTGGLGAGALAACLALVFLLPPRPAGDSPLLRGTGAPAVTSPAPDTVIRDRTPEIRWTPLEHAVRYRITVREVGGDYAWQGESVTPAFALPSGADLPVSSRFRVDVEPVPAHAAPGGRLQSSFRTGSWGEFVDFRLGAAPPALLAGALAGLAGLLAGAYGLFRHRS